MTTEWTNKMVKADLFTKIIGLIFLIEKSSSRMILLPGMFLPPQVACPAGQILTTVPEQACTSPFSCQIITTKRCIPKSFPPQVSLSQAPSPPQAPFGLPIYSQANIALTQAPAQPQFSTPFGSDQLSSRSWANSPQTSRVVTTEKSTTTTTTAAKSERRDFQVEETTTPKSSLKNPEEKTTQPPEVAAPVAFSYKPNLQPPPATVEKKMAIPVDGGNESCKIVYEKVCAEGQTPKCQVFPKSSCNSSNETTILNQPKTPGCTVQYLKACDENSTPKCSVVPQKICLDGTKTDDSEALKAVLSRMNKTASDDLSKEPKSQNISVDATAKLQVNVTSNSTNNNESKPLAIETKSGNSEQTQPIKPEQTSRKPEKINKDDEGSGKDVKPIQTQVKGSIDTLGECPQSLKGYDCVKSSKKSCKRIETPYCGPQAFEKCTISPSNDTARICNSVLKKICRIVSSFYSESSYKSSSLSGSQSLNQVDQSSQTRDTSLSDDDSNDILQERSKREIGLEDGEQKYPYAGFLNHFGPSLISSSQSDEATNNLDEVAQLEEKGYDSSKLSKRDVSDKTRAVTTCVQKQVQVCSTNFTAVPKSGFKTSCVEVPSFSCKEVRIQGPYGISSAENCTQYRRQICNNFKSFDFVPQPQTVCQNATVPDCYDEVYDSSNIVVDKVQKPSTSVVKCEEVEDQLCGLQRTVELVIDECFSEERSACQSGYIEKCSDLKQLKCKSKSTGQELSCLVS